MGVNNMFDGAPGCNTCDLNNFDPTAYDIPGRFYYARVGVKWTFHPAPAYTPPPPPPAASPPPPPPPPPPPAAAPERGN